MNTLVKSFESSVGSNIIKVQLAQTYITPFLGHFFEVEDEYDDGSDGCCMLNSHLERQTKNTKIEKTIVKKKSLNLIERQPMGSKSLHIIE